MQGAGRGHTAANLHVLAHLSRDGRRIVDRDDLLVLVRHKNRLLATLNAFLSAGRVPCVGALCPAFRVADPAGHARIIRSRPSHQPDKTHHHYQCSYLPHDNLRCLQPLPAYRIPALRRIAPLYQLSAIPSFGYKKEREWWAARSRSSGFARL